MARPLRKDPLQSADSLKPGERRSTFRRFLETVKLESGDKRTSDEHAIAWRRGFFVMVLLFGFSEKKNYDLQHRPEPAPFVIEHDRQTGEYVALGPAKPSQEPLVIDREVAIGHFIERLHGIDGTPVATTRKSVLAHVISGTDATRFVQTEVYNGSENDPSIVATHNHRSVTIEGFDVKAADGSSIDVTFQTQLLTLDDQPVKPPQRFTMHVESVFVRDMPLAKLWDAPDRLRFRVLRESPAPRLR